MSFMLAQLARVNPADSELSQQAYKWAQLCARSSENAPDSADKSAVEEIHIAIKTIDRVSVASRIKVELDPKDIAR
jgi:head-tail adaptor